MDEHDRAAYALERLRAWHDDGRPTDLADCAAYADLDESDDPLGRDLGDVLNELERFYAHPHNIWSWLGYITDDNGRTARAILLLGVWLGVAFAAIILGIVGWSGHA